MRPIMKILTLLSGTPLWAWGLLAALVALGLWLSRARAVTPVQLLVPAAVLLVAGAASSAPAFAAQPWLLLVWAKALLMGLALGRRLPTAAAQWDGRRLHVPASPWPLVVIVSIFALRWAGGVAQALHPEWAQAALPLALQTALYGALSGLLAGRSLALWLRTRTATIAPDVQPERA